MTLTANRWRRLDQLFNAAIDLPYGEREIFVARETADDADLRRCARLNLRDYMRTSPWLPNLGLAPVTAAVSMVAAATSLLGESQSSAASGVESGRGRIPGVRCDQR